jgi:hypothetical protein
MTTYPGTVSRQRAARRALAVVGPALAGVLLALGFGLLLDSRVVEDLARIGVVPSLRLLLGVFHLAGGLALLAPSLTELVSILLGLVVSGTAVYLLALGQGVMAGGPALMAVVLVAYGVATGLRHRATEMCRHRMLLRYGEQLDEVASREL